MLGVLVLAKKFLGFLNFFAKILAIILGKVRKILQDFSKLCKKIQKNWTSWQENQEYSRSWQEKQGKSWISCQENFWIFGVLAKILTNNLGKVRKILQNFSRSWKEIQEYSWSSGKKSQNNQELGKRNKKGLYQSDLKSLDIL